MVNPVFLGLWAILYRFFAGVNEAMLKNAKWIILEPAGTRSLGITGKI